jgi:hypothetical protein
MNDHSFVDQDGDVPLPESEVASGRPLISSQLATKGH